MPAHGTWLECNGQSTAGFPALAAVVGANVPDYQGIFLRGYGSQTSDHYGTVTHSSAALGVLQGDAIRNITGGFHLQYPGNYTQGAIYYTGESGYGSRVPEFNNASKIGFDASRVVPIANENRPINRAVRYLIKAA